MLGPVCLLVLTEFSYHVHKHLVSLLNLSVGLSMVRWSPNLPYAHELTQLFDDVTFKTGTSNTQELDWGSKDWDVSLPQKVSNSLYNFVGGPVSHDVFHKVFAEKQNVHHASWLISSIVISVLVKYMCRSSKRNSGNDGLHWWFDMGGFMLDASFAVAFYICVAMLGHQNQSCHRYSVCCWPWCPASLWHPFIAATWWATENMNHITSPSLSAGVWQWFRAPW